MKEDAKMYLVSAIRALDNNEIESAVDLLLNCLLRENNLRVERIGEEIILERW